MSSVPRSIQEFLSSRSIAVAGVSRDPHQAANHIYKKLRTTQAHVVPINPRAERVEGDTCYPDLSSVPDGVDAVFLATPPESARGIVEECARLGIRRVWMHRSFGQGSVSDDAVKLCREKGISVIVGACPMMFVEPVDVGHRCFRWVLGIRGKIPA
jgi:predicted CoA-binding protein